MHAILQRDEAHRLAEAREEARTRTMVLARRLQNDYHRREAEYRCQIQEHHNTIIELHHDVNRINNIINPIPPPVAVEEENPNVLVIDDDGMEEVKEDSEEEVEPWEDDHGDAMSGVDSDHSKA